MNGGGVTMEKLFAIVSFIIFCGIIYLDFFQHQISLVIPLVVLLVFGIISTIFSKMDRFEWKKNKNTELLLGITTPMIILALINGFYLFGGRSSHGINPTNIIIWILCFTTIIAVIRRYKKTNAETT